MNQAKLKKLSIESLLAKKNNYMKAIISLFVLGIIIFLLGKEVINIPSALYDYTPSLRIIRKISYSCFIFSISFFINWKSIKNEIKRRYSE